MRFKEIKKLFETTQLDEVSMSPTNLQKFANSPEANGMLIGIEFEMAVPNVDGSDDEDSNYEPDYSYNESCTDISEIVEFFQHGDFASMGRSDANRVRDDLFEEYMDWSYSAAEDYINDNDDDLMSNIRSRLGDEVSRDDTAEEAHTRWVEENPDGDTASEEASEEIRNLTLQMMDDKLDAMMEDTDSSEYQNAYDNAKQEMEDDFRNSGDGDMEAWLSDIGVNDMQDAAGQWGLDWPHMEDTNYNNGGASIETVADEFAEWMGLSNVNSSSNYHGAYRDGKSWCIEPDSSIDHDENEAGLEFISPPLPLKDGLEQMTKIIAWANDKGCRTNSSTGLHMNISVPDYNFDHLDFVKLALFMGDEHILEQFGRTYNNFCKSALKIVKEKIDKEGVAGPLLQAMRDHLNVAASKAVHNGSTQKYTSINTQTGYVEFRGPGGDYLNQDISQLISTALRLAQSLRIATDPLAHKQEYAKKLYKLVVPTDKDTDDDNSVAMFTRYAMGQIKKDDLLNSLRQSQSNRKAKKFPNGPKREWTVVRKSNPGYKVSFNASSAAEALQLAKNQIGGWQGVADEHFKVTADATGDSAFNKAREEHYLATMDPMWQKFIRDIATIPTERLKKRKAEFENDEQNGGYTPGTFPEWKKIVLARINNELATREGGNEPYNPVDNVEELSMTWQEFVRDIQNKTHDRLTTLKTGIEQHDHGGFTDVQKTILINAVNNELARRAGTTTGIDDLEAIASDTLAQTSTWQLYDPATDEIVATYTGLTQSQAAERRDALRRANGDNIEMRNLGSAEQSTAQASTGSSLWDGWLRTLPTRNTDSINSFRDQIRAGQHDNTLPSEHERDVVVIAIDDELRRRRATTASIPPATLPANWKSWAEGGALLNSNEELEAVKARMLNNQLGNGENLDEPSRTWVAQQIDNILASRTAQAGTSDTSDSNATSREIFDSLSLEWQNWLQGINNQLDHSLNGMIRTIEAETGDIARLTVRQRAFIKSTIHQELRRRSTNNAVAALRPGGALPANSPAGRPDWNDDTSSSSEVAGTRTYTIYDSMDRIVNTIRSTSAARALDEFGENNDIDTTHYTARPTVGIGQSTYSVEHIPTGEITQVVANDAADAIQRQATATGGLPMSLRIAQATPYADDADERERMRSEREQISQDMAQQDPMWIVGNHTYGRETIRAPSRDDAINSFAHNNGISVDDVTSGPSFIAEPAAQTNESIDLIRKLAGLK